MPLSRAKIEIGQVVSPEGRKSRILVGRLPGEEGVAEITMHQSGKRIRAVENRINGCQEIKTHGYFDAPDTTLSRQTLIERLREIVNISEGVKNPIRTDIAGLNLRNRSDQMMLSLLSQADQQVSARQQLMD